MTSADQMQSNCTSITSSCTSWTGLGFAKKTIQIILLASQGALYVTVRFLSRQKTASLSYFRCRPLFFVVRWKVPMTVNGVNCFFAVDRQKPEKVSLFSTFSSGWFWLDHGPCDFETLEHHYGFWKPPLLCLWFRNFWQKWFPCAHGWALGGPQEVQVQ